MKIAILAAMITGMLAFATGCSDPCGDIDCGACPDATADPLQLGKGVCEAVVEADDSDACDAYTGCGAP